MTSRTTPKTVLLGGDPRHAERPAVNGPITPGMLLALTSADKVRPHNVAGGQAQVAIAREADYAGESIDDQYENDENVPYYIGRSGDRFYALLAIAQEIAVGALLESAGNGTFRAVTPGAEGEGEGPDDHTTLPGAALVQAIEAVTTTDAIKRIKVEVL